MANFFDQFDEPKATAGGNFFDQFDEKKPAASERSGVFLNSTAGLNEAIYSTIGAPVDLPIAALNLGIGGMNSLLGTEVPQIEASAARSIGRVADHYIGVPDPETVQANTTGERIARAAGQGAGYMLAPELAVRGAAKAVGTSINPMVQSLVGSSSGPVDNLGNAAVGALAGATGSAAGQAVPEPYRPLAEMGGNLIGGGIGAVAMGVPRMASEARRLSSDYLAPLSAGGQERVAGQMLRDAATDPAAVRANLQDGRAPLVTGSHPTTFQQTGDMGLGSLERTAMTRNPAAFQQRAADQNAARLNALGGIQPQGSPEAVVGVLRRSLADLDQSTGAALEMAQRTARDRTAALGGAGTPEGYGATLRQMLDDAHAEAKAREGALWEAVDPGRKLVLDANPIRQQARRAVADMPMAAKPMEGEELDIINAVAKFGDAATFREVAALRTRVNEAMSGELSQNGRTAVYARLTQLRWAIERSIEETIAGKAAQEAEAVASGTMRQEDTVEALIQGWTESWRAGRAQAEIGASVAQGAGGNAPGRAAAFPSAPGADWSRGGQSGQASGSPGVPGAFGGSGLVPNFDAAARDRLNAASNATKQRARTYERGPVGDALRRAGTQDLFRLPLSEVPSKFFRPGARGYEDMQALRKAASDPAGAVQIRDYAISTLRRAAEEPDGTLNPSKVDIWRRRHADALRALPEIDRMLADPLRASEAMVQVAASRKQALDAYQAGLVGRLLGVSDPADVTKAIGSIFTSQAPVQVMKQLVRQTGGNPEAVAGLRKGVADHFTRRVKSFVEAATSEQRRLQADGFQRFVDHNLPALREVFKPEEVDTLRAIAADIQRSQRTLNAVRIPGQSNSAQDVMALVSRDQNASMFTRILAAAGPGAVGAVAFGPWTGLAAAIGGNAVMSARKAGLQRVDDIIADAMLNPARARLLLQKAGSPRQAADIAGKLAESYRRSSMLPVWNMADEGAQPARPFLPLMMPMAPAHGVKAPWVGNERRSDSGPSNLDSRPALVRALQKAAQPERSPSIRRIVEAMTSAGPAA